MSRTGGQRAATKTFTITFHETQVLLPLPLKGGTARSSIMHHG